MNERELQGSDTVNRKAHYAAFTVQFGIDSSCLQVRDLKCFIYSDENILNTYLYINEQLKSHPHSGHESDRIKNGVITPGSFITAEPVFK